MATGGELRPVRIMVNRALMEDSTVFGICAGRVSGSFPEDAQDSDVVYPMVIVPMRTGRKLYNPVVQSPVFEVWAYSRKSQDEAAALYDACGNALQAEHLTYTDPVSGRSYNMVAQETQQGTEGWNQATRAWYTQGRWSAIAVG